jgi:PPOX class probable F420-dependent enzyme
VGEQAHDGDEQVVEERLVGARQLACVLERDDHPLRVVLAAATPQLPGQGREVELVPVDAPHVACIGNGAAGLSAAGRTARVTRLNDKALRLLRAPSFGFLAVDDGGPHVSPLWVDTDGTHVLVNTAVGRVKERAMPEGARVALSVSPPGNPYEHVDIRGRVARRLEGEEADEHIRALGRKYHGEDYAFTIREGERRVKIWIEPTTVA